MRAVVSGVASVLAATSLAHAQPGPDAPLTAGYVPPPYAYQPTPEEQELLRTGDIPPATTAVGGVVAILIGFGAGQGVEGRWHDTGWMFTLAESASAALMLGSVMSLSTCVSFGGGSCSTRDEGSMGLLFAGAVAFTGFHIWEIVDAFAGPSEHNTRLHDLRRRLGYREIVPYVTRPQSTDNGMTAGLALRF